MTEVIGTVALMEATCPLCGKVTGALAAPMVRQPQVGDFAMCSGCFAVSRFDASLRLVVFTADEWQALPEPIKVSLARQRDVAQGAIRRAKASEN